MEEDRISAAYALASGLSGSFILNGLKSANTVLGSKVFNDFDWEFDGTYDPETATFYSAIRALRNLTLEIGDKKVLIREGEHVNFIKSSKWGMDRVTSLCHAVGIDVRKAWHGGSSGSYG
jgi:uncharacterized SAM-dependent methyltransferase